MSRNSFMETIGEKAKFASQNLSRLNINKKNSVLKQFSQYLKTNEQSILNANKKDVSNAKSKKINGSFEKGDHILVKDQNNNECARGLTSFSSIEIEKIKGSHSSKIKNILGYSSREEIIHKDDLVKV